MTSSIIPSLTRTGIMPYFLTTAHWQMHYPLNVDFKMDLSMVTMKKVAHKHEEMRYCPDWSTGDKCSQPNKNDKVMTFMDHIKASSKKKHKRTVKLYCTIYEKCNPSTLQCVKNPLNCKLEKTFEAPDEMFQDKDGDGGKAESIRWVYCKSLTLNCAGDKKSLS